MATVRKVVIPAAGLGTRFLPETKTVPKELLPIVDTPSIQYLVKDCADAGIEQVVLVLGRGKNAILDHFDYHLELERKLEQDGKHELAQQLHEIGQMVEIVAVRQAEPKGLGHAVLCAKDVIGNEPFIVMLPDDFIISEVSCTRQMINVYEKYQKSVLAIMEVPEQDVTRYGIVGGTNLDNKVLSLNKIVEKPKLADAPSNMAIVASFLLTPEIFGYLETQKPGAIGEIQLTEAVARMVDKEGVLGYKFDGVRYDTGDKFGYIQTNIMFALKRPDIAPRLMEYMKSLVNND